MNEDLLTGYDVSNAVQHLIRRNPIEDQGDRSPSVNSIKYGYQVFFGEIDQSACPSYFERHATRSPILNFEQSLPLTRTLPMTLYPGVRGGLF